MSNPWDFGADRGRLGKSSLRHRSHFAPLSHPFLMIFPFLIFSLGILHMDASDDELASEDAEEVDTAVQPVSGA